jgi:hypothetical protein
VGTDRPTIRFCRGCGEDALAPLWSTFSRCLCCGSDSNALHYDPTRYDATYLRHIRAEHPGSDADYAAEMRPNLDWFVDYEGTVPHKTFLDIGFLDGVALDGMQSRGWGVHGFDVIPDARLGDHTTIAPRFAANLFPQQYYGVMAREVIEHVDGWRQFLAECHGVTARGGLFQLQTPRPLRDNVPGVYCPEHLVVLTPTVVRYWLERLGFSVLDYRLFEYGQVWMCRK